MKTSHLASTALLCFVLGCTAELPDGRFGCTMTSECPTGFACGSDHLCHRGGSGNDAAVPNDAGTTPDTGGDDAASCTDCITLTVTNAYGPLADGVAYMVEGVAENIPPYGQTDGPYEISIGTNGKLDFTSALANPSIMVTPGASYAAVLGLSTDTAVPTILVLEQPHGTATAGTSRARVVDLTGEMMLHALADPSGGEHVLSRSGGLFDYTFTNGDHAPVVLTRNDGTTTSVLQTLAAFDPAELPGEGFYYVFVAGRPDRHLGAPDGLRLIAAVPGAVEVASLPLGWIVNATNGMVTVCRGSTSLAVLVPQTLGGPFVGSRVSEVLTAFDTAFGTGCSGAGGQAFSTPDLPTGVVAARMLTVVVGDLSTTWGGGGGFEGGPPTTDSGQLITYANGSPTLTLTFGTTGMVSAATVDALVASSYDWPSPPPDLTVDYGGTLRTFAWAPSARAAAVLALTDGTAYVAYELDTPYGQDWGLAIKNGT